MQKNRNRILNIIIVLLTVVLFGMLAALFVTTAPRKYGNYTVETSDRMLRSLEYGDYQSVLEAEKINYAIGEDTASDTGYKIANAAADYYDAAICHRAYEKCGRKDEAAQYLKIMDASRKEMGEYSYIADNIDEYVNHTP